MTDLVFNNSDGESITTSLIVAEVFGKNHADVLRDIRNLHCSDSFHQSNFAEMFITRHLPFGGSRTEPYYEMTKNGFSFLVMGYTGEKAGEFKEKFINEFDRRDALLKNDDYIMLRAFEIQQKKIKYLEDQYTNSQLIIESQKPKVLFADSVSASEKSILIGDLAKILKQNGVEIGQNRLFQWLRNNNYLLSKGDFYNRPSQRAMELKLFEIEEWSGNRPDGEIITNFTVKVTGKGQIYFVNKFLKSA